MGKNTIKKVQSGWGMLFIAIMFMILSIGAFIVGMSWGDGLLVVAGVFTFITTLIFNRGFFVITPNHSTILMLFGNYKGSVVKDGFHWANPFMRKIKISLRVRNQETSKLKVNDASGNPIEIAAVVVWRVVDPYGARFEVDAYNHYVSVQSESALRNLASHYKYDGDDDEHTLRGATDEVNEKLQVELQERLNLAGVKVMEARLSHLAYAPEIASEMLKRQQASAVVAARTQIVEGAVGMVEHALEELNNKSIVELDNERKATMVSNLLVVLCSETPATPIVNTGTLYQ